MRGELSILLEKLKDEVELITELYEEECEREQIHVEFFEANPDVQERWNDYVAEKVGI